MDFCRNMSVPGGGFPSDYPPEQVVSPPAAAAYSSKLGVPSCSVDDLFPTENLGQEEGIELDNLEWLSNFVEDCLSSSGNCINPPPLPITNNYNSNSNNKPTSSSSSSSKNQTPQSLQKFLTIPGKARTKRSTKRSTKLPPFTNRITINNGGNPQNYQNYPLMITNNSTNSSLVLDPSPLLVHQAYWLADSELIHVPKKENNTSNNSTITIVEEIEEVEGEDNVVMIKNMGSSVSQVGQARRCTHCLCQRTPQWRAGPLGPKTLCNACGVRFKSGRLLPEYRPAKSPTFVSYKHSNSHKKVLEMRMSSSSSSSVDFPSSNSE